MCDCAKFRENRSNSSGDMIRTLRLTRLQSCEFLRALFAVFTRFLTSLSIWFVYHLGVLIVKYLILTLTFVPDSYRHILPWISHYTLLSGVVFITRQSSPRRHVFWRWLMRYATRPISWSPWPVSHRSVFPTTYRGECDNWEFLVVIVAVARGSQHVPSVCNYNLKNRWQRLLRQAATDRHHAVAVFTIIKTKTGFSFSSL